MDVTPQELRSSEIKDSWRGYDRDEVDDLLERCKRWREKDDRVQIKEYDDLVTGDLVVHAFYVKYLLPIYFDVQCMERGGQPVPA